MIWDDSRKPFFLSARYYGYWYLFRNASSRKARKILQLSRRPIIIGGCGRSGTTLLLSVLSCHPAILGIAGETVGLCPDGYGPDGLYKPDPDLDVPLEIWRLYSHLIENTVPDQAQRWCEKTPRNVVYFEKILQHFGKRARLIHIVRDGRDVMTSRHPLDAERPWATPHRWIQDVAAGAKLENHPQVYTVRYEDLLTDYEASLRSICEFIGEEFVQDFLNYPESSRVNRHMAWSDGSRKINTSSIGRWRDAKFKSEIDAFVQDPEVERLLKHFGYE